MAISPLSDFAYKQVLEIIEKQEPDDKLPSEDEFAWPPLAETEASVRLPPLVCTLTLPALPPIDI